MRNEEKLINKANEIIEQFYSEQEKTKGFFNIYKVLQLESDEVKLHSRFIGELLNPDGSHSMNDIFLRLFIETVDLNKSLINFDTKSAIIETEKFIGAVTEKDGGRLDICITDKNMNIILIENKVFAGEQENQLIRYHEYLRGKNGKLFYLTLFGEESRNDNTPRDSYQVISYSGTIIKWLDKCLQEIEKFENINVPITQYLKLVNELTNDEMKKETSELVDIITKQKENLHSAIIISKSVELAKREINKKFWTKLSSLVKKCFNNVDYLEEVERIEIKLKDIENKKDKLVFTFQYFNNFFYSISYNYNSKLVYGKGYEVVLKDSKDAGLSRVEKGYAWEYPQKFKRLNLKMNSVKSLKEPIFQLLDEDELNRMLKNIVEEAKEIIVRFCRAHKLSENDIIKYDN